MHLYKLHSIKNLHLFLFSIPDFFLKLPRPIKLTACNFAQSNQNKSISFNFNYNDTDERGCINWSVKNNGFQLVLLIMFLVLCYPVSRYCYITVLFLFIIIICINKVFIREKGTFRNIILTQNIFITAIIIFN